MTLLLLEATPSLWIAVQMADDRACIDFGLTFSLILRWLLRRFRGRVGLLSGAATLSWGVKGCGSWRFGEIVICTAHVVVNFEVSPVLGYGELSLLEWLAFDAFSRGLESNFLPFRLLLHTDKVIDGSLIMSGDAIAVLALLIFASIAALTSFDPLATLADWLRVR